MTDAAVQSNTIERLIFTDLAANNNKWWQAELNGSVVTVTFGRVGDRGQSAVHTLGTDAAARRKFDSLVASKLKKGYTRQKTMGSIAPSVSSVAKVQID